MISLVFMLSILFLLTGSTQARIVIGSLSIMSDGSNNETNLRSSVLEMGIKSATVTCTPTYGFLPCTTVIWGNLFLIVVYEYLLSLSQKYVTEGSQLFFKMFGTGIFGASMFQILGTFPPVVILLVNGLIGTTSTAETLAAMGLAMLAGSAVMMLTLQWGAVVAFGSHDLSQTSLNTTVSVSARSRTEASSSAARRRLNQTSCGVTQDADTKWVAKLLLIAMIPFLILQLPQIFDSTTVTNIAILVALTLAAIGLITFCVYEIFHPAIQKMALKYIMDDFLEDSIFTSSRSPNEENEPLVRNKTNLERTWLNYAKAGYFLVLGTAISVLLAQPLMEAISNFADALSVPSFIITYIIVPFAMSYRQVILSITSASKKTEKAVSLTLSMIYSGVFMSSMMNLTMFLLIVYVRDLTWDVSAGVLVVLIIGVLVGCLTSFTTTFPFWTSIVAFLLYPISLVLIYVLTTYCGWS